MTGDPANLSLFFFSFLTDTFWPSGICGPLVRCEMVAQWTAPANDYNDVTVKKKKLRRDERREYDVNNNS